MVGMNVYNLAWIRFDGEMYKAPYHVLNWHNRQYWFINLN